MIGEHTQTPSLLVTHSTYTHTTLTSHTHTFRHLTQHLPRSAATVPVSVQLSVPERNFIVKDVILLPEENMASVLTKLRSLMEEGGLEVQDFPTCEEFEVAIVRLEDGAFWVCVWSILMTCP